MPFHHVVALLVAVAPAAQEAKPAPKPAPKSAVVRVVLTTKVDGKAVPRLDRDGKDTGARRWTDRVVEWRIGDKTFTKVDDVERELTRIRKEPTSMRDDPLQPGQKTLLPFVVDASPDTRWGEILRCWDAAMASGFEEWSPAGVDITYLTPKSVDEPVSGGGALVVPQAVFNVPDDNPDSERPTFEVQQDGSIVRDDEVLFRWQAGKEDDFSALSKDLRGFRARMEAAGRMKKRKGDVRARIDVPVLIRADKWCEWRDVRRLLLCLLDPEYGIWKLEVAVAEVEMEVDPAAKKAEKGR
ncbi:MAG: hypothetical protein U1E73_06880 [Planctomycetota bacterium]